MDKMADPEESLEKAMAPFAEKLGSMQGEQVAVAVGSRNIDRLAQVVTGCIRFLKRHGKKPFIVPAMGSHGGASAAGQKEVLGAFGIDETTLGVPIKAEMDTVRVCSEPSGLAIHVCRAASLADHIVLINRIKPHTKFYAPIESGLCKMLTIGLGKDRGANLFHQAAVSRSFSVIETAAERLLSELPVLFGIALMEDGYGHLADLAVLGRGELIAREKEFLLRARKMMGTIPFDEVDILIIDRIGKDISGIGMDSNVTGRHRDIVGDFSGPPHAKRIFVRDLTPKSDGNANGIGLADVTTARLVEKIDRKKTYINAISAISPEKAAIPMHYETDWQCMIACARTCGINDGANLRIVRIRDTSSLDYLQISRPLEQEAKACPELRIAGDWGPMKFDENELLKDFYPHA